MTVAHVQSNLNDTELSWDIVAQLLMVFLQGVKFYEVAGLGEIMYGSHMNSEKRNRWCLVFFGMQNGF